MHISSLLLQSEIIESFQATTFKLAMIKIINFYFHQGGGYFAQHLYI